MLHKEVIGDATLYLGNCLDILPGLGSVDHVITDPPYESVMHRRIQEQRAKKTGHYAHQITDIHFSGIDETRTESARLIAELSRGWALAFCMAEGVGAWRDAFEDAGAKWKRTLVWIKPDAMPQFNGQSPAAGFECAALAWCGAGHSKWNGGGKHGTFVYSKSGKVSDHPTEKPLPLMSEIVTLFSDPMQVVGDFYMGSGTTGVACVKTGRKFIGIELDPDYFQIACRRIEDAYKQPDMFIEPPSKPVQEAMDGL